MKVSFAACLVFVALLPLTSHAENSAEQFEEKLRNTERSLSEEDKVSLFESYSKASNLTSEISQDFQTLYDAIGDYNRTQAKEHWKIIYDELEDDTSDYHGIIFSKLRIAESELSVYLHYLQQEDGYSEKVSIANGLRNAPPTTEVFEFLEKMAADPNNVGLVAQSAGYSLRELQGRSAKNVYDRKEAINKLPSGLETVISENLEIGHALGNEEVAEETDLGTTDTFSYDKNGDLRYLLGLLLLVILLGVIFLKTKRET